MAIRARFFDDYRLSRIEEEADRLSLHSDISCSVDLATAAAICPSNTFNAQRSASADGTLESTADDDDDDNDDYELPLPPPHLTYIEHTTAKTLLAEKSLPTYAAGVGLHGVGTADEDMSVAALRALHFMQAKYDSLGKVKVEKPLSDMMTSSPSTNQPTVNNASPDDRSKSLTSPDCNVEAMSPLLTVTGSARNEATNCYKATGVTVAKPEICFKLKTGCSRCTSHGHCCRTASASMTDRSGHVSANHVDHVTSLRQSIQGCDHSGKCCDPSRVQNDPLRTSTCCSSNDQSGKIIGGHTSHCESATRQPQQQHPSMMLQQHQQQHQRHVADSSSSYHHHHHQQHSSQSSASSNASSAASTQRRVLPLTTAELFQVDLFYRSFKTIVHVSTSTACLYTGSASTATEHQHSGRSYQGNHHHHYQQHTNRVGTEHHLSKTDWKPAASGIPVIVLDQRSQPSRLHVILAERGTGFELWRQTIDKTDQYSAISVNDEPVFHVVNCPPENDSQRGGGVCARKMGLHFDDPLAATEFHRQLLRLADHDRLALLGSGRMGKKKLGKKGGKGKRSVSFSKADISQPCCFTHVTRLERDNGTNTLFSRQSENTNITTTRRH